MELAILTAAPFLLALFLALPIARNNFTQSAQTWLSSLLMAGLFLWLLSAFPRLQAAGPILQALDWLPALGISLSFYLDGLSLLFALIITGVGALIFFYCGFYFEKAHEHNRFVIWLLAFSGAMLAVVLAGNLLLMFVAWELTSITSFVLIGFKGKKDKEAREGAFKALFVTSAGALALIIGIVMLSAAAGSLLYPDTGLRLVADFAELLEVTALHQHEWFVLFALLILLGGFTKSAQFPFHFWLPGAMAAPTPASAYLHSATMVKAGLYLFARLSPVMHQNGLWTSMLLTVGLITMLIGAYFAVKQRDLKGMLAYSTISKLGAIVAMMGLPGQNGLKAAFVGIIAHALYKSALFLVAGTVDHATGTRLFSKLGGLSKQLPALFVVTVISALSMAGLPFLMGFVAKETLLEAMWKYSGERAGLVMLVVTASSAFTAMAAYMLIYDVFLGKAKRENHIHQMPRLILLSPLLLALASLCLGFLLEPLVIPLLQLAVPKTFKLQLFPGFNEVFILSLVILLLGLLLFLLRRWLIAQIAFPLSGDGVYHEFRLAIDWVGDQVLRVQSGRIRWYLAILFGAVAILLIASGALFDVSAGHQLFPSNFSLSPADVAKVFMLALSIVAGLFTVWVRVHIQAAIAFGVIGYAIGVIMLIEHAPDVALVQMLVETMVTVLIILMLGHIPRSVRDKMSVRLGGGGRQDKFKLSIDLALSAAIGISVFLFSLIALQNRPERASIASWHLNNAQQVNANDVVGAIVADFRGTDTLMEIAVFTAAALGLLSLLGKQRYIDSPFLPAALTAAAADTGGKWERDAEPLSTPFTRSAAYIVLAFASLISIAQILYGGNGPGDGFAAGVTLGLAVTLLIVVFGYNQVRERHKWFRPEEIVRLGLGIGIVNALMPVMMGRGFMGYVQYDKALGIYDLVGSFGLHFNSSLVFEIAIALTVMGGLWMIIEAIAYDPAATENGDSPAKEESALL